MSEHDGELPASKSDREIMVRPVCAIDLPRGCAEDGGCDEGLRGLDGNKEYACCCHLCSSKKERA